MADKKITRVQVLNEVKELVVKAENELFDEITNAEATEVIEKLIAQIEKKAEKEKERAKKNTSELDELAVKVLETLDDENWYTIEDILSEMNDEEATKAKVAARLTKLGKFGKIEKDKDKKKMVYRKIVIETEETAETDEVNETVEVDETSNKEE